MHYHWASNKVCGTPLQENAIGTLQITPNVQLINYILKSMIVVLDSGVPRGVV
jgi:hypothetical protein